MKNPDRVILLIEDSPDDQELTLRALKANRIMNEVVVMDDGVEALDYLFAEGAYSDRDASILPQIVLLDLQLPKLNGLQVLERIRSDPRTRLLPVVILTSSREERDIVEGYSLGANSYVRKPIGFDEFREAVRNLGLYWLLLNEPPPARGA